MKQQDVRLIIVPDIHGRTFWMDVFDYDTEIVFLGDYLDPYKSEQIPPWDALENFERILLFARKNPKVHLLLGNHDLTYAKGRHICHSRCDDVNYEDIKRMFVDNEHLFSLAYDSCINGKNFFISHAGITWGWYARHRHIFEKSFQETLNADYVNQLYRDGRLDWVLAEIGYHRLGEYEFGSIVWADIYEHIVDGQDVKTDIVQIVGHTQRIESPLFLEKNYPVCDVDFRQCVYIDSQGVLRVLSTGVEIPIQKI